MADKPKPQDPKTASSTDPFNIMSQFQDAGFGNMTGMGTAWMEVLSDMNAEVVGFVTDRIKADMKTQQEILSCKNAADLSHVQAKFLQNAMNQYQAETGKIVEIGTKVFGSKDGSNKTKP